MGTSKIFESLKYEGVRYKNLTDGNISFYVRYTTKDKKRIQKKLELSLRAGMKRRHSIRESS